MNQEDQRNLAIACGAVMNDAITVYTLLDGSFAISANELAAYTAAVEAQLQARIAQLEEALKIELHEANCASALSIRPDLYLKECRGIMRAALKEQSSWLSEHDKEVTAKERERCAVVCESDIPLALRTGQDGIAMGMKVCAEAIRELK